MDATFISSRWKTQYREKLKDPLWQKKRLEIFERDNWTCRACGKKNQTLHVHHTRYESGRNPWDYEEWMLLTLCEDCHDAEKNRKEIEDEFLRVLRATGIMTSDLFVMTLGFIQGAPFKRSHDVAFAIRNVLTSQETIEKLSERGKNA